jgi:flagellin-like hook-associated protein FlgL
MSSLDSVHLSGTIRKNLLNLSRTTDQLSTTEERLSSGLEVASAADDPYKYFAASNLNDSADILDTRLDGMEQSVEIINAADNGIDNINDYITQMQGIIEDALSTTDEDERRELGEQFNELIVQIRDMAEDSDYGGVNLLCDNDSTTVYFDTDTASSKMSLQGVNIEAATGSADDNGEVGSSGVYVTYSAVDASGNTYTAASVYALTFDSSGDSFVGIKSAGTSGDAWEIDWGSTNYQTDLDGLYQQLEEFSTKLETQSSLLETDLSTIDMREDFTDDKITIYQEGADKYVAADLNEEGANELTLETAQSLEVQCLSLANSWAENAVTLLESA